MHLILFDIDGTLLTTNGIGRRSFQKTLEGQFGEPINIEKISFSGKTDPQILRELLQANELEHDWTNALQEKLFNEFHDVFAGQISDEAISTLDGAVPLLEELSTWEDTFLGLVTGNLQSTGFVKLKAAGLDRYFTHGAFGSDHEDRNMLPAIALKRACEATGAALVADRATIIGDTPRDVECARAAGMRCIAVCTGRYSREELATHEPDVLLDDLTDTGRVLDLLRE